MRQFICLFLSIILHSIATAQQPVTYIENKGQWDEPFLYRTMGQNTDFFIENNGYTVVVGDEANHEKIHDFKEGKIKENPILNFHAYRMRWVNAKAPLHVSGDKPEPYVTNFFLGNDRSKWRSKIYPMKAVDMQQIYPGVNVRVSSSNNNPKIDYVLSPHADPMQIQMRYSGLEKIEIKESKLILYTSLGEITELEPYAYQDIDGERVSVPCSYRIIDDVTVGFEVAKSYNKNIELTIDPELVFASLTGSTSDNWGFTATYDADGNLYGGGIVNGGVYPYSDGAFQTTYAGGATSSMPCDIAISKFSSDGSTLLYSTLIGGSGNDYPHSMFVDGSGNLFISGKTSSSNFPTVTGSYDITHNGGFDIYVLKLNEDGSDLLASTFIGGTGDDGLNFDAEFSGDETTLKYNYGDNARGEIVLDSDENVYVASATKSTNFPVTTSAVKSTLTGAQDGVVFKLNETLSTLTWSTYIGGADDDAAYVLAFNSDQSRIYVAGGTQSDDFMNGYSDDGLMSDYQGGVADGFICKFQNSGTYPLETVTFIGTSSYDQVFGIQVDKDDDVYVMGQTLGSFPVTAGVYTNPSSRQFLMKLDPDVSTNIYSTVWGIGATTKPNIVPVAFLVDTCENVYISGWGGAIAGGVMTSLPITDDAIQATTDGSDFYFIVLNQDAEDLLYATYFGSSGKQEHVDGGTSRFDPGGIVYQAICASCSPGSAFPATDGAWSSTKGTSATQCNLGVVKLAFNLGSVSADAEPLPSDEGCAPFEVTFENNSVNATDYSWNFGDGGTSTAFEPSHTFTTPGVYEVRLIASNENGCTPVDTAYITITVTDKEIEADFEYEITDSCDDFTVVFTNTSESYSGTPFTSSTFIWRFGDGSPDYEGTTPPAHDFPGSGSYTVTLIMFDPEACTNPDSIQKVITFDATNVEADFEGQDFCVGDGQVVFNNTSTNGESYFWNFGDGSTSTSANPSHTYSSTGSYTVYLIATNPDACNQTDTITKIINVYPVPEANFHYTPMPPETNQPTTFINTSIGATSYNWDFGDGTNSGEINPVKQYNASGSYNVCLTATNEFSCKDSICKMVQADVRPLLDIPTAFTPDGDGTNDILFPRGFAVQTMNLKIYNRWGELVFESNSMSDGWDGTYKGVEQPMEAYAFVLTAKFLDGTDYQKQGNVTLIR